ncbi:hypothetical protein DRI50_09500 [candidate division KSB1 bacterium]|nr:MAG: hypothetical protein DRI50_09500 [candidate division KSB1 bacterium]
MSSIVFAVIIVIAILIFLFEYRLRRPDELILTDKAGQIKIRKGRYYPKHFSLAVPATIHSLTQEFESEARGKLPVKIRIVLTTSASTGHLTELVRSGGWNKNMVQKATEECAILLQSLSKAFCEQREIEELSAEALHQYLQKHLEDESPKFGLQIIQINVQSIEPADPEIAEAMQQQEAARIREKTEHINQEARLKATQKRLETDEKIKQLEHQLALKELNLKKEEQEKEALLARLQVEQELERRRMQFEMEQKELKAFEEHPELLLLSPQIARLAEASQQLRNARTVVSLSGVDQQKAGTLMETLEEIIQRVFKKEEH